MTLRNYRLWNEMSEVSEVFPFRPGTLPKSSQTTKNRISSYSLLILLLVRQLQSQSFWDIRLKIFRLPNCKMLFQLERSKFFKTELFSCLPKVDHVITSCKEPSDSYFTQFNTKTKQHELIPKVTCHVDKNVTQRMKPTSLSYLYVLYHDFHEMRQIIHESRTSYKIHHASRA